MPAGGCEPCRLPERSHVQAERNSPPAAAKLTPPFAYMNDSGGYPVRSVGDDFGPPVTGSRSSPDSNRHPREARRLPAPDATFRTGSPSQRPAVRSWVRRRRLVSRSPVVRGRRSGPKSPPPELAADEQRRGRRSQSNSAPVTPWVRQWRRRATVAGSRSSPLTRSRHPPPAPLTRGRHLPAPDAAHCAQRADQRTTVTTDRTRHPRGRRSL